MKISLDTLHLGAISQISLYLDIEDYVSLRDTCRNLYRRQDSEDFCRQWIKVDSPGQLAARVHADCSLIFQAKKSRFQEAQWASAGECKFSTAIQRMHETKANFLKATPSSIVILDD